MLTRLGAWCGVAAGLCIAVPSAVEAVTGETAPTSFVLALSPALAIPLLVVLHLRQHPDTFGTVAFTVNAIGLGLFGGAAFTLNTTLFYLDDAVVKDLLRGPTSLALLGSALVFAAGTILFGTAMLRAKVHPRIPAATYLVAFPVLAVAAKLPDTPLTSAVHLAAGASLIWLSAAVMPSRSPARALPAVTPPRRA